MIQYDPAIYAFKWSELDGKIFKIRVAASNVEAMEPGQVFALDTSSGKIYVLAEFGPEEESEVKGE